MNTPFGENGWQRFADRRRARWPRVATALLLPGLLAIVGCKGCDDSSTSTGTTSTGTTSTGKGTAGNTVTTGQWGEALFDQAINNLNRLEEFNTSRVYGQILERLAQPAPPDGAKGRRDALMQTCPLPEMLQQIVNRLNQWVPSQEPPDWELDPLVATLPPRLRELPCMKNLDRLEFPGYDGFALREAVWLRDASDWARGEGLDDVERARRLFDWTVRNVQLEAGANERIPLMPWETLLFGRGTAVERVWLFVLLARQQGLDAVVLRLGGASDSPREYRYAWVAVLIGGKLYLFDPMLGLPIPAPDGVTVNNGGPLNIRPATLSEVIAEDALLRRLDFEEGAPYPVSSADLKRVEALVEGSPAYLARRMKLVESRLSSQWRMVLTTSPKSVADRVVQRLESLQITATARLWTLPLETLQRRRQLDRQGVLQRLEAMLPFYSAAVEEVTADESRNIEDLDPTDENLAYKTLHKVSRSQPVAAPLRKGRVLYLKGKFGAEPSPIQCLMKARKPDRQLKREQQQWTEFYTAVLREQFRRANRPPPEDRIKEVAGQRARSEALLSRRAKQDASYWLGLIALEQGDYDLAITRFSEKTLHAFPGGTWEHGARYNLARTFEAQGNHRKAIEYYLSDRSWIGFHGSLLRARWLQGAQSPSPDQPPPATEDEPAADLPEPAIE